MSPVSSVGVFVLSHPASTLSQKMKNICKSNSVIQSKETSHFILTFLKINQPLLDFGNPLGHKHSIIICFIVIRSKYLPQFNFTAPTAHLECSHVKLYYAGGLRQLSILPTAMHLLELKTRRFTLRKHFL